MALLWRRNTRKKIRKNETPSTLRHFLYGLAVFIVLAGLISSVWHISRLEGLTIKDIEIDGGETLSHDSIRAVVERELTGSWLVLLPYRFYYFYPKERIIEALNSVSRVHNVVIEEESRTMIRVSFDEFIPFALWCMDTADFSECYFVNEEGYAFTLAPPLRGGALVRHIVEGTEVIAEGQMVSSEIFATTKAFIYVLARELGFRIGAVTYTKDDDLIYSVSGGGDILVASAIPAEETFLNLQSILESSEFSHIKPGNFNYIDLRFGNKVFVNEEVNEPEEVESIEVATSSDEI